MDIIATVLFILIMVLLLVLAFWGSLLLARRSICTVIRLFRSRQAVHPALGVTPDEIGIKPRGFFSFHLLRDYKPWALQTLISAGIVRPAIEDTLYLSEEKLEENPKIGCGKIPHKS